MLSSGGVFTRYWLSFTRLWKSETIPRRCYSNGDFLTSVEGSIVTPFMKVGLLFMYTSYFYLTSSRSKMRLRLWNDPCNVCNIFVKSLCTYASCRKRSWHRKTVLQGLGEELPRILNLDQNFWEFKMIWSRRSQVVLKTYVVLFFSWWVFLKFLM
jgi:hypothetical protein